MIELVKLNVHRLVSTKEEADKLIANGFKVVPEQPPEKHTKAKG